jgi:hypothetical protein
MIVGALLKMIMKIEGIVCKFTRQELNLHAVLEHLRYKKSFLMYGPFLNHIICAENFAKFFLFSVFITS